MERKPADVAQEFFGHFVIIGMRGPWTLVKVVQPEKLASDDGQESSREALAVRKGEERHSRETSGFMEDAGG